jgi:putative transposase
VDRGSSDITIHRQCELLGLPRSSYYYEPAMASEEELMLMRNIDRIYTEHPYFGWRRIRVMLERGGMIVGRDRILSLMKRMGIQTIYPRRNLSKSHPDNQVYPYLLRGIKVDLCNHVWSTDITYIPLTRGFVYLCAVIDWASRRVMSWRLSNTLDVGFCLESLEEALLFGTPYIFNTDQGSQFTCQRFVEFLKERGIKVSMDGRGRATDNAICERLWRSVKTEDVYLKDYQGVIPLERGLESYFSFYNHVRPHQSLGYRVPMEFFVEAARTERFYQQNT